MTQERMREVLTEPLTAEHMARRSSEGWIPVAVEWQREAGASTTEAKGPRIQVPYGLEVAEGGGYLQESGVEMAVLRRILSQIVDDRPLSEIAERLSELGSAQRNKEPWTQSALFELLPRVIEVAPSIYASAAWQEERRFRRDAV